MERTNKIPGKNGGQLHPVSKGEPAPPGAGRRPNPFKKHIHELADSEVDLYVKARLLDDSGFPTGDPIPCVVKIPGALAVVAKAFRQAAKGDSQARKWLSETGWGRQIKLGEDEDNPLGAGFAVLLPDNKR